MNESNFSSTKYNKNDGLISEDINDYEENNEIVEENNEKYEITYDSLYEIFSTLRGGC